MTDDRISDLEDRSIELSQSEPTKTAVSYDKLCVFMIRPRASTKKTIQSTIHIQKHYK